MVKKKAPKTIEELTKGFEKLKKEYSENGKDAFRKVIKKAVSDK